MKFTEPPSTTNCCKATAAQDESFEECYARHQNYYGAELSTIVRDNLNLIPPASKILDFGAGQGRNSLALARLGHEVTAVDASAQAIRQIRDALIRGNLALNAMQGGVDAVAAPESGYAAIILTGVLTWMSRDEIARLFSMLPGLLRTGGLLFISAILIDDTLPGNEVQTANPPRAAAPVPAPEANIGDIGPGSTIIGKPSLSDPSKTLFRPGELQALVNGAGTFETIYLAEGFGKEHRHGDGPLETHLETHGVFRRKS